MIAPTPAIVGPTRARQQLWHRLRLVVFDTETTDAQGGGHRIVSLGMVSCQRGRQIGKVEWLVNPGVPISAATRRIHGITDEVVKDQPAFAEIAPRVLDVLLPRQDETVVLVAHNARFDVPVLREELERAGETMPDLAVIDTSRKLPVLGGVAPASHSLADLLGVLGVTNRKPHDALSDATATAEAVCDLLGRVAVAGHTDLATLLAELDDGTARALAVALPGTPRGERERLLPEEHLATHAEVLSAAPGPQELGRWLDAVDGCATLRCPLLGGRSSAPHGLPRTSSCRPCSSDSEPSHERRTLLGRPRSSRPSGPSSPGCRSPAPTVAWRTGNAGAPLPSSSTPSSARCSIRSRDADERIAALPVSGAIRALSTSGGSGSASPR